MTLEEIVNEVRKDYDLIGKKIIALTQSYAKRRKKLKIKQTIEYKKHYSFTSKMSNKWHLVLSKSKAISKYKNAFNTGMLLFTSHYSEKGFRVFLVCSETNQVTIFNGHLFQRYIERMNLNIQKPLEKVLKYFEKNNASFGGERIHNERKELISKVSEGILLGTYVNDLDTIIFNTFIPDKMVRTDQSKSLLEAFNNLLIENPEISNQFDM